MPVHSKKQAQVEVLLFNKAFTKISEEYSDYNNVFSAENMTELPKHSEINEHAIELEEGKELLFGSIYSLSLVELEMLKTYIKTNLANNFIRFSKFLAKALIFFDQKPNGSFCRYIDYRGFNNFTIKN